MDNPYLPLWLDMIYNRAYIGQTLKMQLIRELDWFGRVKAKLSFEIGSLSGVLVEDLIFEDEDYSKEILWEISDNIKNEIIDNDKTLMTAIIKLEVSNWDVEEEEWVDWEDYSTKDVHLSLVGDFDPPSATIDIIDVNPVSLAITEDNKIFIRCISHPQITTSAVAYDDAGIEDIIVEAREGPGYGRGEVVTFDNYVDDIIASIFDVTITDTRGLRTTISVEVEQIPYSRIKFIDFDFLRDEDEVGFLVVNGNLFGGLIKDTLNYVSIRYRIKRYGEAEFTEPWEPVYDGFQSEDYFYHYRQFYNGELISFYDYVIEVEVSDILTTETKRFYIPTARATIKITDDYIMIDRPLKFLEENREAVGYTESDGDEVQLKNADGVNLFPKTLNPILDTIYPIGRGFIDFTNTDYSNYLGFTWEKELVGMTPVGLDTTQTEFNTIGKTGGSKTHTHQYGIRYSEYYSFISGANGTNHFQLLGQNNEWVNYTASGTSSNVNVNNVITSSTKSVSSSGYNSYVRTDLPNSSNLQPYKVVNFWKRIA